MERVLQGRQLKEHYRVQKRQNNKYYKILNERVKNNYEKNYGIIGIIRRINVWFDNLY